MALRRLLGIRTTCEHPQTPTATPAPTPTASAAWWRCIGVTDGDTFTCLDTAGKQQKVKVSEIDGLNLVNLMDVTHGTRSQNLYLVNHSPLFRSEVLQMDSWFVKFSVNGKDIGREMVVARGMDIIIRSPLLKDQQDAKEARRGLWVRGLSDTTGILKKRI